MSAIKSIIDKTLEEWNQSVSKMTENSKYELRSSIRKKKYFINKVDFYEEHIGELMLFHIGSPNLLLYRIECAMPDKVKGKAKIALEADVMESLHRNFLYECIGSFCAITQRTILNQDHCEYDIEKDRLKQHESAVDMTIKTLEDGDWYKANQEFDVFMDTDNDSYHVYTMHMIGRGNNGIAGIKKDKCLITQAPKKQIILV